MAAQPVTADSNFLTIVIPAGIGGTSLVIVLAIVLCAVLVYRRRRQRPLVNRFVTIIYCVRERQKKYLQVPF